MSFLCLLLVLSISGVVLLAADYPTDEQISKIITTANMGEINTSELAIKKAGNKKVVRFAKKILRDHATINKKTLRISAKADIIPKENEQSRLMQLDQEREMALLQKLNGKDFEKAYMEIQVVDHQKLLNDLDKVFIPNAKNKKLKKQLEKTRDSMARNLFNAKKVQFSL